MKVGLCTLMETGFSPGMLACGDVIPSCEADVGMDAYPIFVLYAIILQDYANQTFWSRYL